MAFVVRGLRAVDSVFAVFLLGACAAALGPAPPARAQACGEELVLLTEGNRLRRFDVDTMDVPPLLEDVLIERAAFDPQGRDVNGQICPLPDGSGRFVLGEDTGQPNPPAGWGVFSGATQVGKLTATYFTAGPEPFGCAFDANGDLFTSEVGNQAGGAENGQLIQWFPPFDVFPGPPGAYPNTNQASDGFCKIATDIGTAASVATDEQGRVYVASARSAAVRRFSPPFPTGPDAAGGCGRTDALGSPLADADRVNEDLFVQDASVLLTPSGIARAPNGNWYLASVLTGVIAEYDAAGAFVRLVLSPPPGEGISTLPISTGHPQSLAVDCAGNLYFADLDLRGTLPDVGPGPDGKLRRIRFDASGNPQPPEIVRAGLSFPDGVAVLPGDLEPEAGGGPEWRSYGAGPERRFFQPAEGILDPGNVAGLREKWAFPTGAIVTASPTIARVDVPGEGVIPVVFVQSWDGNVYAIRLRDGTELWRFATDLQPGAAFPGAGSAHVERIDGADRVFVASGETLYALDAASGALGFRFDAGTGCGDPPGLCGFSGERNEIETSPLVAGGLVLFGMDVNDRTGGKGGFYAVDARDGRLVWYFDVDTGATCRPDPGDAIVRFDGYHGEAELGLPEGFLATRAGCDFDRTGTGCGNVWSSPAWDAARGLVYFGTSNCDTDADPGTLEPPPPMSAYNEALVALSLDGTPAWRWRPREVDNADLAFGATPQLFTISFSGAPREVVGIGGKDGAYYVLDRDGVNELTGLGFDPADPLALPYWWTQLVPGGAIGGVIGTPAVDEPARRVYVSTAPGLDPLSPQLPTLHALDLDGGAILWQNAGEPSIDASFGPTTAFRGVVLAGSVLGGFLRVFDADTGQRLARVAIGSANASGAAVVDGTVVVGAGVGQRTGDPSSPSDAASRIAEPVTALCVEGTPGCGPICADGIDNDRDGKADFPDDPGCRTAFSVSREDPACDDGADNDGDGHSDFPDDPQCRAAWDQSEHRRTGGCGLLGAEALLLLWLVGRRAGGPRRGWGILPQTGGPR